MYDYLIYSYSSLHLQDKYELTIDQLPVGLIAQLVRALHWYRRGHGFDSRSSLNFSGFFFQLLKFKHLHCDDLHIILSLSAVQYVIISFTVPKLWISQSEALFTVMIFYDIKSLTWYPTISWTVCVLVEVGALISWCIYSYKIVMLLVPYMWASMTFLPWNRYCVQIAWQRKLQSSFNFCWVTIELISTNKGSRPDLSSAWVSFQPYPDQNSPHHHHRPPPPL